MKIFFAFFRVQVDRVATVRHELPGGCLREPLMPFSIDDYQVRNAKRHWGIDVGV
jgi:hypothetical protein